MPINKPTSPHVMTDEELDDMFTFWLGAHYEPGSVKYVALHRLTLEMNYRAAYGAVHI